MIGARDLHLNSLENLVRMKAQALAERKLIRAVVIDEIIAERLNELTVLFMKGGD